MATAPDLATDLALIARQEAELRFPSFDYDTAWRSRPQHCAELAQSRKQSIVIDIRRFGQPHQPLFYTALGGTPDNARWVQRKSNVVARFHRCSYAIGLTLEQTNRTFLRRSLQPPRCRIRRPRRLLSRPCRQRGHHRLYHRLRPGPSEKTTTSSSEALCLQNSTKTTGPSVSRLIPELVPVIPFENAL